MRAWFTNTERVTRSLALLLAFVAIATVTTAWVIQHKSDQQRAAVSDNVPAALSTTSPTPPPSTSTAPPATATPTHRSKPTPKATPKPLVAPIVPQHLYAPAIMVNTTIVPKPTQQTDDPFIGKVVPSFGVPNDMYTTTWWSSGPRPGAAGMAVILGHTQIGGYGVFNELAKLKPNEVIGVSHGHTTLKFMVMAVHTGISKKNPDALQNVLEHHPAAARLALLTCSGTFNQGFRESAENTVVFARLVSVSR